MPRPATQRLKCNPPLGRMPALQYLPPGELAIDPAYQRSLEASTSQTLIRRIAQHWNWDLCQPLVVSARDDGRLYVIDGQHRLAAARLRGDIAQLPAVVVRYAGAADEAASFVHLNQQRRPLTRLDLFRAAVASEDAEARALLRAVTDAGLAIAPHSNNAAWKPGQIANIGGIEACWRAHGERVTREALTALARAYPGQVLTYAGTLFPGIAAICHGETGLPPGDAGFEGWRDMLAEMIAATSQQEWRDAIMRHKGQHPDLKYAACAEAVFRAAWSELLDGFFDDEFGHEPNGESGEAA